MWLKWVRAVQAPQPLRRSPGPSALLCPGRLASVVLSAGPALRPRARPGRLQQKPGREVGVLLPGLPAMPLPVPVSLAAAPFRKAAPHPTPAPSVAKPGVLPRPLVASLALPAHLRSAPPFALFSHPSQGSPRNRRSPQSCAEHPSLRGRVGRGRAGGACHSGAQGSLWRVPLDRTVFIV